MVRNNVIQVISFLKDCLEDDGIQISKIIVFGSQAEGRNDYESDIDIIILSESFRNMNHSERVDMTTNAEIKTIKKFIIPVDIFTLSPEEFEEGVSLVSQFAKNGEVFFAA